MSFDFDNVDLFIFGFGGHAKVVAECADVCSVNGRKPKLVFVVKEPLQEDFIHPVISESRFFELTGETTTNVFIAIGDNFLRSLVRESLRGSGPYTFPTLVHPNAIVSPSANIGEGTLICAGAIVGPGAVIGKFNILNHGCVIDHDCKLFNFCLVGPNATMAGGAVVGNKALIGASSTILPSVRIGADTTVGAGSVVVSNVPDFCRVAGVPAKAL